MRLHYVKCLTSECFLTCIIWWNQWGSWKRSVLPS